ncbi:hypothetical protein JD844_004437 [Phrynosoma platyrhinos]|uniref:Fibronectin type-III domain-containing protein n=1 Tax=Phrynosoma platyrhinos TaxID=52577 RepID=A0ABQ7TNK1_PHRPL|nr:hypothetical protein JD844_004437 [Phrynosoma platyrhinos]
MAVATWIALLLLIELSIQQGAWLLPPQNVTLISENFYSFLTWIPAPDSTNNTQYEVERRSRSFLEWIKEASCRGNNVKQTQRCQLHLSKLTNSLFNFYQARVRAKDGSRLSEWVHSKELQLYKDSIIGPLNLFLVVADESLSVSVSLPQTPLKESDRRVIMSVLEVLIILNEEDEYWTPFVIAPIILFGFILFGVVGGTFLKHYLYPRSSGMDFPKSLTFLNVNASALRSGLHLDNVSITSLSMLIVLPSKNNVLTKQEGSQVQMDAGGCSAWVYSSRGSHQGSIGNEDCSVLSAAGAESFSSGDEYPTQWNYRTALPLLESSEPQPPVRAKPPLNGLWTVSWELKSKNNNKSRQMRWPSLCRTDIPLDSLKLQSDLDIHSFTHIPSTYVTVEDSDAYPEVPIQQDIGSQAKSGLSKDIKLHDSSQPEASKRNGISFSGYEFRQPILPCEL